MKQALQRRASERPLVGCYAELDGGAKISMKSSRGAAWLRVSAAELAGPDLEPSLEPYHHADGGTGMERAGQGSSDALWGWIGRAAVVLGILGGVTGLVKACSAPGGTLIADYKEAEAPLPKALFDELDDSLDRRQVELLEGIAKSGGLMNPDPTIAGLFTDQTFLRKQVRKFFPIFERRLSRVTQITVSNTGTKKLTNVTIHVPNSRDVLVKEGLTGDWKDMKVDGVIRLGDLGPQATQTVVIWSDLPMIILGMRPITHDEGVARLVEWVPAHSPFQLAYWRYLTWRDSVMVFLAAAVLLFAVRDFRSRRAATPPPAV